MFELSFLNASLLFFAAATILPLLIWLLAKKKPLRVIFPSIRFIKLSKEQEKSRSKLKNILLLIIRMLIILLVALAVARPMFRSAKLKPSAKHPPTAIAILLDTSYSMDYAEGGKSSLQYAKEALAKINARATQNDRLILVTSNDNWNQLHAQIYAGTIPSNLIEQIAVTYIPLPIEDMLKFAETKLHESQMPNQEIYLISDNRCEPVKLKTPVPLASIPLPLAQDYANIACTTAKVLPQMVDKRQQQTIQFTLENQGNAERKDVLVQAVVGEIKLADKFVNIAPRQSITESITFNVDKDGWHGGYIEVADERQTQDNRCYFAFPHFQKPKLGVVTQAQSLPFFLSSLLNVYCGGAPQIIRPENLSLSLLDSYQMLVLYEPGVLTPKLHEILTSISTRKLGLLICLGNSISGDMKSYLQSTFGVNLKDYSDKALNISLLNKHHYISSLISDKQLKHSTIAKYWQSSANSSVAIVAAQNIPLAIQKDKQSLWLWDITSPMNTFFMDPAFPVLAFRTFNYDSSSDIAESNHRLGEILSANKLRLPGGEVVVNPKQLADVPGIYTIEPDSPTQSMLAFNIDYQDSQNRNNPPSVVKNLGSNWESKLFLSRLGHDLWKILLAIAFALVLVELIIVKLEEARSSL
ncbi:MAG: BatA and WFA domain-containing protein [Candidatus Cloacimonetes bacterium]|nr:BatA and WFA domain-containing protein [Candidatus Cloacimonadota bacterium]